MHEHDAKLDDKLTSFVSLTAHFEMPLYCIGWFASSSLCCISFLFLTNKDSGKTDIYIVIYSTIYVNINPAFGDH